MMIWARELLILYGWLILPLVLAVGFMMLMFRQKMMRATQTRRRDKRNRNIAQQRAWDWVMGRSRNLRLTHRPDTDPEI